MTKIRFFTGLLSELEAKINEWLAKNPQAKILSSNLTLAPGYASFTLDRASGVVVLWYEDMMEKMEKAGKKPKEE